MKIEIDLWQLASAIAASLAVWITALWVLAQLLGRQFNATLDARFAAMEQARVEGAKLWAQRMEPLERHAEEEPKRWDQFSTQLSGLHREVADKDSRIIRIEEQVRHLPGRDEMSAIRDRIEELTGEVAAVGGKLGALDPMQKALDRINDYLLNATR